MKTLVLAFAVALALASIGTAHSQAYPNRPLRDIVPFPPGGGVDTVTRIVTAKLSEILGQQIVVDNRPVQGARGQRGKGSTLYLIV